MNPERKTINICYRLLNVWLNAMISIRQVEVIRAVLLARSVSGAAQLLNVSAAAVSRMLRHTETHIGFALFSRTSKGFIPTPEANALMEDLESVHSGLSRIQARLAQRERTDVSLRFGTSPGLGLGLVPKSLSEMQRRVPRFHFELAVVHIKEILPQLEFRQLDFALTIYDIDDPRLSTRRLAEAPLVCLMSENHPLSGRKEVTLEEIAAHPLVGYDPLSFQQQLIDELFQNRGLKPEYRARCRLMNSACALVQENLGLTLLDQFTVYSRLPAGTTMARLDLDYRFPLNVITMKDAPLSRDAERYFSEVERVINMGPIADQM